MFLIWRSSQEPSCVINQVVGSIPVSCRENAKNKIGMHMPKLNVENLIVNSSLLRIIFVRSFRNGFRNGWHNDASHRLNVIDFDNVFDDVFVDFWFGRVMVVVSLKDKTTF